jgi:hypothetical protein
MTWLVRQYRPAYFTGFENQVCRVENILDAEFLQSWKEHSDLSVKDYGDGEQIVMGKSRDDGKSWVAAFACEDGSDMSKDWRYKLTNGGVQGV